MERVWCHGSEEREPPSFIRHSDGTRHRGGCNGGDAIAFDAWLSVIVVEMAARMHEVEERGMMYLGNSEDRLPSL